MMALLLLMMLLVLVLEIIQAHTTTDLLDQGFFEEAFAREIPCLLN